MPWSFIPFLFLLAITIIMPESVTGTYFAWDFKMLLVPVSAWIGYRYGAAGVKTVVYACVLLFLGQIRIDNFRIGINGGLGFACIALAWIVSSSDHIDRVRAFFKTNPYRLGWLLILPVAYTAPRTGIFFWSVNSVISVYAAFFILGLAFRSNESQKILRLLICMFVAGAAIYTLTAIYGPLPAALRALQYTYSSPNSIVAIFIFLALGRWCRFYAETGQLPSLRFPLGIPAMLVLILIFGICNILVMPNGAPAMRITGTFVSVMVACFVVGLFYGTRGFLLVILAIAIGVPLSSVLSEFNGKISPMNFDMRLAITDRLRANQVFETMIWFLWTCAGTQLRAILAEKRPRTNPPSAPEGAM